MSTIEQLTRMTELTVALQTAPRSQAIGAAVAFLLEAADRDPARVRAVLHAEVTRVGRQSRRIIDVLTQC